MTSYAEDLSYLDEDELVEEMRKCLEMEDAQSAHNRADEILVAALTLAVNESLQRNTAASLTELYHEVYRPEGEAY